MKKLSITSQIVLLFLLVLLVSASLFTIVTLSRIRYMAEQETFSRLITYSTLLNSAQDPEIKVQDMHIGFIKTHENKLVFCSENVENYLSFEEIQQALDEAFTDKTRPIVSKKIRNKERKYIYYVVTSLNNQEATMIMTNSIFVNNLSKNVSLQLILVFLIVICLSILCILVWSNKFVRRIHQLQRHIINMPKNSYNVTYQDDSLDEIGELSRAIEKMRIEIQESECQKQEMLQNMSHDFKTPIAVIKSYAEAQQDGMVGEDSSKIIIAQADVLKHKVNRLLQYNSLEYLKKDREFEEVNMKELVEEVVQGYRFQTDIQIELDLTEDIYFKGYRENYHTVVDNILDNAKRYAKTKIKVILKKDRLRIYNDGDPIDEQFIQHSFKPYEKGSKGEFGLGMSIVKKTLDFFGMQLIVKNEAIGVSFIITK